jgi:large subunit ribosomal protein L29
MKKAASLTAIRESSGEELRAQAARLQEELFQHRLKRSTNQLENTNLIENTKREIARVNTVLSARKHGVEKAHAKKAEEAK